MKDLSKVMGDLDELARQWQQQDAYLRPKPGGPVKLVLNARTFDKALLLSIHDGAASACDKPESSRFRIDVDPGNFKFRG